MNYAERAHFSGEPCQHVATYLEHQRLGRIWQQHRRLAARHPRNTMRSKI